MADEVKNAPAQESKQEQPKGDAQEAVLAEAEAKLKDKLAKKEEPKEEPKAEPKAEPKSEAKPKEYAPTVGELLKSEEKEDKEPRTVPEAPFLEIKNQNKELKKELRELKELIESGASRGEVSESLKEIAEEHNVDIDFLKKLSSTIKQEAKAEAEAELSAKMKPLEDKERRDTIDTIFNYHYEKAVNDMPEYKDIVNKSVVKSLSLLKDNSSKTIPQIIEESYGHLLRGKKTIDPGASTRQTTEEITDVDFSRAQKDKEYFQKIMADPKAKRKYNEQMLKQLKI